MSPKTTVPIHPMLINGSRVQGGATFDVRNPATGEVIAKVPEIDAAGIESALQAAKSGFHRWSAMTHARRKPLILRYAELLDKNRERIITLLIQETGKPRDNAEYDFGMLTTCLRFFVEEAERLDQPVLHDPEERFLHYVLRQPLGVVVGFLAWNFPLLNLGYKLGPMLAAGCSGVIKPSSSTPLATLEAASLAKKAGIPDGVINVITGTSHKLMARLTQSEVPSLVTMIGSTEAGLEVMKNACTSIKHFSVELGGNAPVLVYPDADVAGAARKIVDLKFANCGQVCVSPNRCFVHESIHDQFVQQARKRAASMEIGPLISEKARAFALDLVASAVKAGARLVCGGHAVAGRGFHMEPTILEGVTPDMDVARREIFGPVLPIIKYSDSDDEIALANDTRHGLAAYVFTTDLSTGLRAARGIEAGSVCVNEPHYSIQLPHGGLKESGIGKDCSRYSLTEYLTLKRVSVLIGDKR